MYLIFQLELTIARNNKKTFYHKKKNKKIFKNSKKL